MPWWVPPLAGFHAADHLGDPARDWRDNVADFVASHGVDLTGGRVLALCQARVLGYVFNPLTVYWCHDRAGVLRAVLAMAARNPLAPLATRGRITWQGMRLWARRLPVQPRPPAPDQPGGWNAR